MFKKKKAVKERRKLKFLNVLYFIYNFDVEILNLFFEGQ